MAADKIEDVTSLGELEVAMAALTERQRKFVELVAGGVTQTEAARAAGFAHKHAASQASHLRQDPRVDRALKLLAKLKVESEDEHGLDLLKQRLWEISTTGTPASRVQALSVLDRIMERERPQPVKPVGERYLELKKNLGEEGFELYLLRQLRQALERRPPTSQPGTPANNVRERTRHHVEMIEEARKLLALFEQP